MTWRLTFTEAWRNLLAHKLRSLLAVLGILIGASSVVAMLSIGNMAKNKALAEFQTLGTDLMAIDLTINSTAGQTSLPTFLTPTEWQQLMNVPAVIAIAPYGLLPAQLAFHGQALPSATAIIAAPPLFSLLRTQFMVGRPFLALDRASNFCVLGADIPAQLHLSPTQALGQLIQIQDVFFTVIGVLKPWQGNSFFNNNINSNVIVSYPAAARLPVYVALSNALLKIKPLTDLDQTTQWLSQKIILLNNQLTPLIRSAKALQATMSHQKQTLSLMLGLMGGIALLVGGIGIMNVMLVSVTERKKEIGLRLAIGAKQTHIRTLFLAEASILGLLGGISGSVLGALITLIISYFTDWLFALDWLAVMMGLLISIITSVFFGFYPAYQAARLNPITVLRAE